MNKTSQTAIVTGASSGLGRATALALFRAGYRVVAGARSFQEASNHIPGVSCFYLDVTDTLSIHDFMEKAITQHGYVDLLVNCAGTLVMGACEETTQEDYSMVMKTNFIAATEIIRCILPRFREQKNGRIVNFSSLNGKMGIPFQSAYVASKHALEGYSECLQMEVKRFGIQVMLIEPGDHSGGSQRYRHRVNKSNCLPIYEKDREKVITAVHRDETAGLSPDRLGNILVRTLKRKRIPFRLRIAKPDQRLAVYLHNFFPNRLLFRILSAYYLSGK